jgi:hypothetical protein
MPIEISKAVLEKYFHMPLKQASNELVRMLFGRNVSIGNDFIRA